MELAILQVVTPYILPAIAINVILDFIKNHISFNKPKWLIPLLCVILSIIIPLVYALLPLDNKPDDVLMQTFGIMGISYFFYDAGGYNFIKEKLNRKKNNEQV